MAKRELAGARAILTGASSGIGWELAGELAHCGVRLVVTARREDRLRELANALAERGGEAVAIAGDITDAALRQRLLETAGERLGGLDLLINNAGMGRFGLFRDADSQRLRETMEVNFFAPVELIRAALPMLRAGRRPAIVNIGSVLGHFAVPQKSEYCASKFALHGFTDALRMELRGEGIDVLLISPSTTATEFFERAEADPRRRPAGGMPPSRAARRIVKAIRQGRREMILSFTGNLAVLADRAAPTAMSRILGKYGA